jgi:hypothetical protein
LLNAEKSKKHIHNLDPDLKSGAKELLIISITVKDRVIKAIVR